MTLKPEQMAEIRGLHELGYKEREIQKMRGYSLPTIVKAVAGIPTYEEQFQRLVKERMRQVEELHDAAKKANDQAVSLIDRGDRFEEKMKLIEEKIKNLPDLEQLTTMMAEKKASYDAYLDSRGEQAENKFFGATKETLDALVRLSKDMPTEQSLNALVSKCVPTEQSLNALVSKCVPDELALKARGERVITMIEGKSIVIMEGLLKDKLRSLDQKTKELDEISRRIGLKILEVEGVHKANKDLEDRLKEFNKLVFDVSVNIINLGQYFTGSERDAVIRIGENMGRLVATRIIGMVTGAPVQITDMKKIPPTTPEVASAVPEPVDTTKEKAKGLTPQQVAAMKKLSDGI